MARRKSCLMRLIKGIIVFLLIIVLIVVGVCVFINKKYGVNVVSLVNDVRVLNQEVNVNKLAPNVFSEEDLKSAKEVTDLSAEGLITANADGTYSVDAQNVLSTMTYDVKLSDRQIAAIIDNLLQGEEELNADVGDIGNLKEYGFKLVQVAFSNIEGNCADINVVFKFDLASIKSQMTEFPLTLVDKMIPESLYFSATTTLTKIGSEFGYSTEGKSLKINNLSEEQTEEVFETLNLITDFGTSKEFAKAIGDVFVGTLIGSSEGAGMTSDLADVGATGFEFVSDAKGNYYIIKLGVE